MRPRDRSPASEDQAPEVVVGVVAAPGAPAALATPLAEELRRELSARVPSATWRIEVVEDPLVQPPASDTELVEAARRLLLRCGWDLAVGLTDLPLRVNRRPVVAHANPVHGVGLLSVPALGAVAVRRRSREATLRLLDALLGEDDPPGVSGSGPAPRRALHRRVRDYGFDADGDAETLRFTAQVLTGNLRLLVGMVRANRPWRLAAGLSRALAAAAAVGAFALVTSDIWRLSDALGWPRLLGVGVGSIAALAVTLVLGAGLWERPLDRRTRQQVVLFNLATTATVLIGVLALYAVLLVLALLAALLLVTPGLFGDALGHPAGLAEYAELAWLTSSLATVGGALGAGLETDDAVREAAYTHRTSDVTEGDLG